LSAREESSASASKSSLYDDAGVAAVSDRPGFQALLAHLKQTFALRTGAGRPLTDFGHFASVLDLGQPFALAISTDGIGTKAIVAQLVDRYDTVGIDCVAMNANDVICVGAEPIAMTDYLAVDVASDRLLEEIGKGLLEGARQANIAIPGGEISQIGEIIHSEREGFGFDLVGTCVGVVERDAVLTGAGIAEGDVIIGLSSSGIHSNGLSLGRQVLFQQAALKPDQYIEEFQQTVGEELLTPTAIYVQPVVQMLNERLPVKSLAHITSDGLLNLARVDSTTGFVIDHLPDPPPIFSLIAERGQIAPEEMFRVFNMGIGFCLVVSPDSADRVKEIAEGHGFRAWTLGHCVEDAEKRVWVNPKSLVGKDGKFAPA
jgi:phosphoribosylformylglycinamidine cyclo-ligase